jgi:peptidyl-prolyl cis-trans isomerase SurA
LERIVAIVDGSPIFLSELRRRATQMPDSDRTTQLKALVDVRLLVHEAERMRLLVDASELDQAIQRLASAQRVSVEALHAEVKRSGLTEAEYRELLRQQLLEGKLLQVSRSKVKVTEADARAQYALYVKGAPIDYRMLVLSVPANASESDTKATQTLANDLAQRAKAGADFCALVKTHGADASTKDTCGSRGPVPTSILVPALSKPLGALRPGETAAPVTLPASGGGYNIVVAQRGHAAIGTYEQLRPQMMAQAQAAADVDLRSRLLADLRSRVFVEERP